MTSNLPFQACSPRTLFSSTRRSHSYTGTLILLHLLLAVLTFFKTWGATNSVPSDWKFYQTITLTQTGFIKLALPPETMNVLRSQLDDLRMFSPDGQEVPYLLERPAPGSRQSSPLKSLTSTIQGRFSILDIELGTDQPIEGIALVTPVPTFLKPTTLEESNDRTTWRTLAQSKPLFRLADGTSQLSITIPPTRATFLRITISDEQSAPIPFTEVRVLTRSLQNSPSLPLRANASAAEESAGESRIRLQLGAANLYLSTIQLDAAEPFYQRTVAVLLPGLHENEIVEEQIASADFSRMPSATNHPPSNPSLNTGSVLLRDQKEGTNNQNIIIERQIPTDQLTLAIRNSDAPPLHMGNITVSYRPFLVGLYLQRPGTYLLATGNPQARAPKYEMTLAATDLARIQISDAQLGPLTRNPAYREPETLPGIGEVGAPIDLSGWRFRKQIQTAEPGIYQIQLDPETLSLSASGLYDLRVIQKGFQLPYLLQRTGAFAELAPKWALTNPPNRASISAWRVVLPFEMLPLGKLTAQISTPLFQRTVSVFELDQNTGNEPEARLLGQTTWTRRPGETIASFSVDLNAAPRSNELLLETENGDNPPISMQSLKVSYPVTRVLFKSGSDPVLHLYFGNERAHAPEYDLAIVGEQIIKAERKPGTLGPLESLQPASFTFTSKRTSLLFWTALVVVFAGLIFVLSRLLPNANKAS